MKAPSADREAITRYIRDTLLPAIGCAGRPFTLTQTELGIHTRVLYLDIEGRSPLVLKAIGKRKRFRTLCACAAQCAACGVSAPRIVHADEDSRFFNRRGFHVVCEERIMGHTLFELGTPEDLLVPAAAFFASLHNTTRPAWGVLDRPRTTGLHRFLTGRMREKLAQWRSADPGFPARLDERVQAWAAAWRERIDALRVFSLSHGDPNPGNIMVTGEGKLVLLDIGHLRYMPRAIDYCMLKLHLCRDDAGRGDAFEAAYLSALDPNARAVFTETESFFALYVCVDFAAMLSGRLRHTRPGERYYEEYRTGLATVLRMIEPLLGGN